jgi:hypothetical protein
MRRPVQRKPVPFKPSDAAPEVSYLTRANLLDMKQSIVESILQSFAAFREFIGDENLSPTYRARFEEMMENNPPSNETILFYLSAMEDHEFNTLKNQLEKRLNEDIKLYYTQRHRHALTLPRKHTAAPDKGVSPEICEQLRYYNFALELFEKTQLNRAEMKCGNDIEFAQAPQINLSSGVLYDAQQYKFNTELQCVDFVNGLLPPGKRFTQKGQLERLN